MKVLIIDRDRDNCDQMRAVLEGAGAQVTVEPIKNTAAELVKTGQFDAVFFDPTPQNELRPFIMGIRRSTNAFPPIAVMGHNLKREDVLKAGGNEYIGKPWKPQDIVAAAEGSHRISALSKLMNDESEDFPSKEGLIAKSAFNQLFITCLDRADRHGETSYLIMIELENIDEIAASDGPEAADKVADALRRKISRARRTSDIAGHIRKAQFCLLLLRPARDDEPFLAANRFAQDVRENHDLISTSQTPAVIKVSLLAVPTGAVPAEHIIGRDA